MKNANSVNIFTVLSPTFSYLGKVKSCNHVIFESVLNLDRSSNVLMFSRLARVEKKTM